MTITYTGDVCSGRNVNFTNILFRWHGSVWKSVYKELFIWIAAYILLSVVYRHLLNPQQRNVFEDLVAFGHYHVNFIPLNFILGFFVTLVIQRWWEMFNHFGWIDNVALYIGMYIEGTDDRIRMIRRNIIRYVSLVQAMVFRDMSPVVRRRFPNDKAFEEAGFLTEPERRALESIVSPHGKYWVPIHWSFHLIKQARQSGNITSDRGVELIQERLREFRTGLAKLRAMHWVPVPLAYTQVVFLAVRSYLALSLLGRQHIQGDRHHDVTRGQLDLHIPLVSVLQFIFYLGWVKVAEALLNPFGYDDDDFECNWFIDRNLQMGLSAADDAIGKEPPLDRDVFWNDVTPVPLYGHGTMNLPIYKQKVSIIERTAKNLSNFMRSRIHRTNKVADSLNQEVVNEIPDSADQQMFKEESRPGLVQELSVTSLGIQKQKSETHQPSKLSSGSNAGIWSSNVQQQNPTIERRTNSTIVTIDDD